MPQEWQGKKAVYLIFKGAQRSARVFLNGMQLAFHPLGYTEFVVRLDDAAGRSLLQYGLNKTNVLAVFIDATFSSFDGTAWWCGRLFFLLKKN